MTYKTEFPDFELDVEIPKGFNDVSWHNDVCPSFINRSLNLCLWIDYADKSKSEFPNSPHRFQLTEIDEEGCHVDFDGTKLLTADFDEVLEYLKD